MLFGVDYYVEMTTVKHFVYNIQIKANLCVLPTREMQVCIIIIYQLCNTIYVIDKL